MKKNETLLALAFFIVVSFVYLGANIFAGEISAPMDLLLSLPGFSESGIASPEFWNPERSDILDQMLPEWIFERDQIIHGNFPSWDPFRNGGMPADLPSLPTLSEFFRIDFLLFFIFGNGIGFTIGKIAILTIAGLGIYKLCREEFDVIPSLFAGVTLMMSGFMAVWLMGNVDYIIAWLPWFLFFLKKVIDKPSIARASAVSISLMMIVLGSFPFLSFMSFSIGLAFLAWMLLMKYIKREGGLKKPFVFALLGIILGLALAATSILPFKEWIDHSYVSWRHGGTWLTPLDIDILWSPFKYNLTYSDHIIPKAEYAGYIGILAVSLIPIALIGIAIQRKKLYRMSPIFWIIISLFLIIIIFNITPISSFIYNMPIFNDNASSRCISILGVTLSIIAAYGFQKIIDFIKKIGSILKKTKIINIITIIIASALLILQIIDLDSATGFTNAVVRDNTFFPSTPTISYVKENLIPGQNVITTDGSYMISGTLTGYGIPEWFAQALLNPSEKEMLGKIVKDAWVDPYSAVPHLGNVNLKSDYMNALFVRYVLTLKDNAQNTVIPDNWQIIEKGQKITILENKLCPPGAYLIPYSMDLDNYNQSVTSTNGVKILKYSTDYSEYLVTNADKTRLVVPLHPWPGWKAYVNGKPVEIEPYLKILSSVKVDSSPSTVEFKYESTSLKIGIASSSISAIIIFSLWAYERKLIKKSVS